MKIKKIHLKMYKRFKDLTIDLGDDPKRIVALVGPNGCGKSSVFDGIVCLNSWFGTIGNSNTKDSKYHSLRDDGVFNIEDIDIKFDTGDFKNIFDSFSKNGKGNTLISFRSPYRYSGNLNIRESRALNDLSFNQIGAGTASDVDQRIEEEYRRLIIKFNKHIKEDDLKYSVAMNDIVGDLNKAFKSCLNITLVDLGDIGDNRGTLFFKKDDSDKIFEYNVLSSGEKEVIDILLDLYLRKDKYNDTIYIIDEPELHINTSIQRQLLIEINKMIPDNCQIWIATHSIGFMRALQVDFPNDSQVIRFDANKKWASEEYILKPIIPSRREWLSVFETAIDDLAELVSPKKIVYCEGKVSPGENNEENGLDANVYNQIFYEEFPDTVFVSSGSHTTIEDNCEIGINILSKVYKVIEILILKDLDCNSGKPVDLEFREQYLKDSPANHRILNRLEIENYLYDKEILKAYCNSKGIAFNEVMYDSIVKDIVLDDVKEKINEIMKCCGEGKNIRPSEFKLDLAKMITKDTAVYKELKGVIFGEQE